MENSKTIADILRNCPLGRTLFSPVYGDLRFENCVLSTGDTIHTYSAKHKKWVYFDKYGYLYLDNKKLTEDCMLFPSRGNRMWDNWYDILFNDGDYVVNKKLSHDVYQIVSHESYGMVSVKNINGDILTVSCGSLDFASYLEIEIFKNNATNKQNMNEPCKQDVSLMKKFKPFDKVLARDDDDDVWKASFYSHLGNNGETAMHYTVGCDCAGYLQCIPYNDETKHLVGTTNKPNIYYLVD